jgi:FkbM family methyltransferase
MNISKLRIELIKLLIDVNEKFFFEWRLKYFYKNTLKVNTVIDVGANKGQHIDFFLKLNKDCKIYAIEPNNNIFNSLVKKYKKNSNVTIFNFGISDSSGEKLFFENVFDYTSSFEELNMESTYLEKKAAVLGVSKENIISKTYPVKTLSLIDFIQNNKITEPIDVLKIDTEGHEYYCLKGLFNNVFTPLIKYIQIESHNDDMYVNKLASGSAKQELLNSHNYYECARIKHGFGDFDEIIFSNKQLTA